jgi:hypothetical protein
MLAGLETRKEKILHVILVGQRRLNENLDHPDMEQLMQRIKLRYHIRALNDQEHGGYIRYRLATAGVKDRILFPPETLPIIYKYAGGVPRLINTLCDTVLTFAYADNVPKITAEVVEAAAKELQWPSFAERIDKSRLKTTPGQVEDVRGILREQSQTLAVIANRVGKLEKLSQVLESIGKSLTAIEMHLRNPGQNQGVEPRSELTANRR